MNPRIRRLQTDYDTVREAFSGHPNVRIEAFGTSEPPDMYRIHYRVQGLALDEQNVPAYRGEHEVELQLPLRYPTEKPYARPVSPMFHPNIKGFFCTADHWAPDTTLVDLIVQMGDMIQWKQYNLASPLDAIAADWASEHEGEGHFPIDNVDLAVGEIEIEIKAPSVTDEPFADIGGSDGNLGNQPSAAAHLSNLEGNVSVHGAEDVRQVQ